LKKLFPTPKRNLNAPPRMYVLRSFDVNKPGTEAEKLVGGVLGGSISQGVFRVNDEIEIRPGLRVESGGKSTYQPITTIIENLHTSFGPIKEAKCGGLIGVGTKLDPSLTKSDGLVGNVVGKEGGLPEVLEELSMEVHLFENVVGTEKVIPVEKIKTNEALVLNIATTVTSGVVTSVRESIVEVTLRKPVCTEIGARAAISRRIGEGWRLIGYGIIK